jgi:hypothetical protein
VPSLLCFRAKGGEEAHAGRRACEETVTPGINSESCNSRYHGELVAKSGHASPRLNRPPAAAVRMWHAFILFSTS